VTARFNGLNLANMLVDTPSPDPLPTLLRTLNLLIIYLVVHQNTSFHCILFRTYRTQVGFPFRFMFPLSLLEITLTTYELLAL
jgi:hypothetical protein